MTSQSETRQSVLISVLNWNTASATTSCVDSLLSLVIPVSIKVEIVVIDNGSAENDYLELETNLQSRRVRLLREPNNLGFAGGHNVNIRRATQDGFDFVWLMNSDAIVDQKNVLASLVTEMNADPTCGVISPLIVSMTNDQKVESSAVFHHWETHTSVWPESEEESIRLTAIEPENLWVPGTAILLRISALEKIGGLDERLFAYFEDDDLGARLSAAGWRSRVDYSARVKHSVAKRLADRPPYFFYLMQRNYLIFWYGRTPDRYRRFLYLKLLDRSFFDANRLYHRGLDNQGDAAMLGIYDFLRGKYGKPDLDRAVPIPIRMIGAILKSRHMKVLEKLADANT